MHPIPTCPLPPLRPLPVRRPHFRFHPLLCLSLLGLVALPRHALTADAEQLPLHARQLEAMGVVFAPLSAASAGASSLALPARVVIPPEQIRVLSAPAGGLIEQFRVAPQQSVRAGERVGQLSAPALLEAQRALTQAASQAHLADETRQRDQSLLAEGIIPAARAHTSQAQAMEAQAVLHEREQALRMLGMPAEGVRQVLEGTPQRPLLDLTAPASGTVIEVPVAAGQRVELGTPLLKIARLDRLWLELQVPVASVSGFHVGDRLEVDGRGARARIVNIGRTTLAESQVVELRAELPAAAGLRPGETVSVRVQAGGSMGDRWLLPAAALVTGPRGPQAYVQSAHGVRIVALQKVGDSPDGPLVRGDLKAGDQVAVRGVAALRAAENAGHEQR